MFGRRRENGEYYFACFFWSLVQTDASGRREKSLDRIWSFELSLRGESLNECVYAVHSSTARGRQSLRLTFKPTPFLSKQTCVV